MPEDAPSNQPQDVYKQQGEKPWLDWVDLPKLLNWKLHQPNYSSDITMAAALGKGIPLGLLAPS